MHFTFSQTNFNSSLKINHGDGSTFDSYSNNEGNYNYSQALYDMNFYSGPWNFHSQLEFSSPPEMGISKKGLRRFTLSYSKNNYNILIGDIYKSWGKGLVLSQYDDISIGYDNGIRGASIVYNYDDLNIEFISGIKDLHIYSNSNALLRVPDKKTLNNVIGLNFNNQFDNLNLGFSILANKEKFAINSFGSDSSVSSHNINSFHGNYFGENLDFSFEYAKKYTYINPALIQIDFDLITFETDTTIRKSNSGRGFAFSSNYLFGVFGISFDYVYYSFFATDPSRRLIEPLPEQISQFQKPMVASQEYASSLLNRLTHLQDSNDEIGLNITLNMNVGENGSFILNSSYASRTKEWYREQESDFIAGPWKIQKEDYIFPSKSASSNPYEQHTISYESFFQKGNYKVSFSKIHEIKTLYDNDISSADKKTRYDLLDAITVPLDFEYNLFGDYSIMINLAYQDIKRGTQTDYEIAPDSFVSIYQNDKGQDQKRQYTNAFNIGLSKSSKWSFNISIEKDKYNEAAGNSTNTSINPLEKLFEPLFVTMDRTWISTELVYRFENKIRLSLFYGSNKGGVSCANGVCRYYPGFSDGFRLQLTKTIY